MGVVKRDSVPKVKGYSRTKQLGKSKTVIDIDSRASSMSEENDSPLRPIYVLRNREKIKEIEKREDCFILEFDPNDISKLSVPKNLECGGSSSDLSIVAEKGQVACRDYPHSRHVCLKYPFEKTPHERCCKLCYCFVCDLVAPCKQWTSGHCDAINNESWKMERKRTRELLRKAR